MSQENRKQDNHWQKFRENKGGKERNILAGSQTETGVRKKNKRFYFRPQELHEMEKYNYTHLNLWHMTMTSNSILVIKKYACTGAYNEIYYCFNLLLFLSTQDCEFLKKVLSIPWTLSTSQQPQQQVELCCFFFSCLSC